MPRRPPAGFAVASVVVSVVAALAAGAGCDDAHLMVRSQAVSAFCEAAVDTVDGQVLVDVETDYLPHVVACENGNAAPIALQAQAVAARSYLYYRLERSGSIGDGTGDQVYTCGRAPGPEHYAAVAATSGLVLRYPPDAGDAATQVAAFFVAGALQAGPSCTGGTDDPTGTEQWVTYNDGLSGADLHQTPLGLVDPTNYANRGCLSQNGSNCLAQQGYGLASILRFYYGADIGIVRADGPCVTAPDPADAGVGVGDDDSGGGGTGDATGGCV
ncbi:MAG: hypothetical protein KC464_02900, partial [Myxococcales bacterium]|nr:hypothetical protein [Myxococcales bacterium]